MTANTKTASTDPRPKPVISVRVGGVRIPIWRNEGGKSGEFYKAGAPEIWYRGEGGQWLQSNGYTAFQLISPIKAAALAHTEVDTRNRSVQPTEPHDDAVPEPT